MLDGWPWLMRAGVVVCAVAGAGWLAWSFVRGAFGGAAWLAWGI